MSKLTAAAIKAAKPGKTGDGNDLALPVTANGTRHWCNASQATADDKKSDSAATITGRMLVE